MLFICKTLDSTQIDVETEMFFKNTGSEMK